MSKRARKAAGLPAVMDQTRAAQALVKLTPTLDALVRDALAPIRIDIQIAAAIAHSVVRRDQEPARRKRLEELAKSGGLEPDLLDRVADAALVTWYTRHQQQMATALKSDASVAPQVVKEAYTVRGRMLRMLEHYFDDDAAIAARVAVIRSGNGLQDLANDLEALADLYVQPAVRELLSTDVKHYREDDAASARQLAGQIFEGLGLLAQGEAARWADLAQRSWTLLSRAYDDLRALGNFAFRQTEDTSITYPSLFAATRSPSSTSSATEIEPEPDPDVDPDVEPPPPVLEPPPPPPPPTPGSPAAG